MGKFLCIADSLKAVDEITDKKKKLEELKALGNNNAIRTILRYAFDPTIVFDLPEGNPPYNSLPVDGADAALYRESRKLYLFIKPHPRIQTVDIPKFKRETLFIELLEVIAPEDAKLLLSIKDKQFPYKTITKKMVEKAIPTIFSGE